HPGLARAGDPADAERGRLPGGSTESGLRRARGRAPAAGFHGRLRKGVPDYGHHLHHGPASAVLLPSRAVSGRRGRALAAGLKTERAVKAGRTTTDGTALPPHRLTASYSAENLLRNRESG